MPGTAARVRITERQQESLVHLSRSSTAPQGVVTRCEIILLAFSGLRNDEIAEIVELGRHQVGLWRRRWRDAWESLIPEEFGSQAQLERAIIGVLSDAPRSGSPGKFTAEQVVQIIAVSCEPPADSGRPVTHWTPRELADEVIKRGIVDSISERQVSRFLKSGQLETASERILADCPAG